MQTDAWLLSGTDVERNLTYERLQKCLDNGFITRHNPLLSPSKPTRSKDDEEVQCLYNKSHRKRHSDSPKLEHASRTSSQYQYLILRNPPADYNRRCKSGDGILPGWMLRKHKSQPEIAVSSVQQPLPSLSSSVYSAQHSSTSDLTNSSSAKTAEAVKGRVVHQQTPIRKWTPPQALHQQQPKQQLRYHDDVVTSPTRQSIDSTDSEGFEYVILRVPAKTRSALNDPAVHNGQNQNALAHNSDQITAKRLTTPEAQNLVSAIRAMKSSPVDPIIQVPKSPSPNHQNYLNSSSWMQDNTGKYEYLILKTPTMKSSVSATTSTCSVPDASSPKIARKPSRKPISASQSRYSDSPQSFHSSTSNTASTLNSEFSQSQSVSSNSTVDSAVYATSNKGPHRTNKTDYTAYQKPHEFSPPLRPRHHSMASASAEMEPPKIYNEFGKNSSLAPAVHSSYSQDLQEKPQSRGRSPTKSSMQKVRRTASANTPSRSSGYDIRFTSEELSLQQQNHMLGHATFWNPRFEGDPSIYAKKGLGQKVKEILSPRKARIEGAMKDQHQLEKGWSVARPMTPPHVQLSLTKIGRINPFKILRHTWDITDGGSRLEISESEFVQIDAYAAQVKQRGPMLTPDLLSKKFLTRPYRHDVHKARAIFTWLVQNIGIGAPLEDYSQRRRSSVDEIVDRSDDTDWVETAEVVLAKRWCKTSVGIARLFCELAIAAGLEETRMIYGYLRVSRDSQEVATLPNSKIKKNHAWCAVKVEGEYRFVDCYLASQFQPNNDGAPETHWFLTRPLEMIYTHLPASKAYQFLDPPIDPDTYFALPYVCVPYFQYNLNIVNFDSSSLELVDDSVCHIDVALDEGISCYAEVETRTSHGEDNRAVMSRKTLSQCMYIGSKRVCRVKAVLPPDCRVGWLKIYAGPRYIASTSNAEKAPMNPYQLAMTYKLTHSGVSSYPFDFVQKFHTAQEFYIQEPQCYNLFPLQTYTFRLFSLGGRNQKLALRSPGGRMYKLLYYPQDISYDGTVTVSEVGMWNLVSLQQSTGGWHSIASWECTA